MSREELQAEYERLRAQADELRDANVALCRELETVRDELETVRDDYERRLALAAAEIAELKRQLAGSKAERLTPEQEEQLQALARDVGEEAERPAPLAEGVLVDDTAREPRPRRRRHPLPADLETETVTLEPEPTTCSGCGEPLERIGEEVTEEIDLIPAKLIRRRLVRPKYACRCGEAGVQIAPLPPRLIPQSRLGLGLAVHVVLARFDDHLSFYRLEQQFRERHGLVIPRQQMVQWVEQIAVWLRAIYDAMWQRMLQGGYLQVDETSVRVLDPEVQGKAARGYLWFYAVPGGDALLVFDPRRSLDAVRERLGGFVGTIQTDAYEVYHALQRRQVGLERLGCLAHARRHFYGALREASHEAVWFILQIRLLYRIERQARDLSHAERQALRQREAPAIWEAMRVRADALRPQLLPKSSLGKAVHYFRNEYEALTGYLRDGRFEIDNNLVENSIRPTAVGRRRWLFIGHPDAGWRSAVIYSLLVSCRRRGINPQDYLTAVLARLPTVTNKQIDELLPENWRPPTADSG
jgi:transposase